MPNEPAYFLSMMIFPGSDSFLVNQAARLAFETEKFKLEEILEDAQRALEINPTWHKVGQDI